MQAEKTIEELTKEAVKRGNSIEVKPCKEGLKVFEVSKTIVKVIRL